jgi:hypothetical protein
MSFDVFAQGFAGRGAAPGRPDAAAQVLTPYVAEAPSDGFGRVQRADGDTERAGFDRVEVVPIADHLWRFYRLGAR